MSTEKMVSIPRTDLRIMILAAFMAGAIAGHSCGSHTAHAHGSQDDHAAHHLGEIAETLKKIERKMK